MTSKNLFFKLMKEDLKSRLWAIALIGLLFFFTFPVAAAFKASDLRDAAYDYSWVFSKYEQFLKQWLSFNSGLTTTLLMFMALVCGTNSFSYLNSKSKVDFYHSIPVRREMFYVVNYLNGILIVAVPYAVMLGLGIGMGVVNGISVSALIGPACSGFVLHMVYYGLLYATVILAVMLTGNRVVTLLGIGVICFVIPAVVGLITVYYSVFFESFYSLGMEKVLTQSMSFSPVLEYILQVVNYSMGEANIKAACFAWAASIVLMGIGYFLYRKRPSETAGKAMAFAVSEPIIGIVITVMSALALSVFFWGIRSTTGWAVFGLLCGGIIAHCVIEIIYHFDFKKLFSHPVQLAGCLVASLVVLLGFRYDVVGYDRYLPEAGKVDTIGIAVDPLCQWTSYGEVKQMKTGEYIWEGMGSERYILEHMQETDVETVLNLASVGISWQADGNQRLSYEEALAAEEREQGRWQDWPDSNIVIQYRMKNGRTVSRFYRVPLSGTTEMLDALYTNETFKSGMYPVMKLTEEQVSAIRCIQVGETVIKVETTPDQNAELLKAYQSDFQALSIGTMQKERPVGLIRFVTAKEQESLEWLDRETELAKKENRSFWDYSDLVNRNYYPVYPSFQTTLAVLKNQGVLMDVTMDYKNVKEIKIHQQRDWQYESHLWEETVALDSKVPTIVISDSMQVKEMLAVIQFDQMQYYHLPNGENWLEIEVEVWENGTSTYFTGGIPTEKIPEFLKEQLTKNWASGSIEEN